MPKPNANRKSVKPTEKAKALQKWLKSKLRLHHDYQSDSWVQEVSGAAPRYRTWQDVLDEIVVGAPEEISRSQTLMLAVLRQWANESKEFFISEVQERIISWTPDKKEAEKTWDTWINAICEDGHELSRVVLRHWIWQIRRKLLRMDVTDHICPILVGCSGCGKSREIRRLIEPLKELSIELSMSQLTDERHFAELQRHYIVYLDELAGARKADRDTLKALITAPFLSSHIFHTQRREHTYQAATLLGSSNNSVADIIRDTTSGRRYWEIRCRSPRLDWDALEGLDRRVLWGSVSPLDESPLDADQSVKQQIIALQDRHLRTRSPVEIWAEELGIAAGEHKTSAKALYDSYCGWCAERRLGVMNAISYGKVVKSTLKWPKIRTKDGSRGWLVNKVF